MTSLYLLPVNAQKSAAGASITISPLQRFLRNHSDKPQHLLLLMRGELFHDAQGLHQFWLFRFGARVFNTMQPSITCTSTLVPMSNPVVLSH